MKQDPRHYVISTIMGPRSIDRGRPHIFKIILEWEPTPKLDKVYANIDNVYCDERCEAVARKEAEELKEWINARINMRPCDACWVKLKTTGT